MMAFSDHVRLLDPMSSTFCRSLAGELVPVFLVAQTSAKSKTAPHLSFLC